MKILITADWHIKGERPICRTDDDWIESQRETITGIRSVFNKERCDMIWILGDVFDAPRCSTKAVNMLIEELRRPIYIDGFPAARILCGNHDLKDHSIDNLEECSIGTLKKFFKDIPSRLESVGKHVDISANPFGHDDYDTSAEIVCTHQLTFPDEASRPMEDCGVLAQDLLDRWPHADVIFTGDYHHAFIYQSDEGNRHRFVVNPGCINIQKADELDYAPRVYVWDVDRHLNANDKKQFKTYFLDPQSKNCTRDHIEAREQKEEMLAEVVETIKGGTEITLDFDSNLSAAIEKCEKRVADEYDIVRQEIGMEAK